MILSNTDLGNIQADGVFIDLVPAAPVTPTGPPTGTIIVVGGANDGPVDQLVGFSDQLSGMAAFGNDTASANSLLQQAFIAMPECSSILGLRISDGTDTKATLILKDTSSATLVTLTRNTTGSRANAATGQLTLLNPTVTGSPLYSLALNYPGAQQEFFASIPAYAVAGGGYNAAAFIANIVSQVNGQTKNVAGSSRWTAVAGSGTAAPATTAQPASGGTDGTTDITSATIVGVDGISGRTGMYAARGHASGTQMIFSGLTDPTVAQTLIDFSVSENCIVWLGFPKGTQTQAAVNTRQANNLSNPSLFLGIDWVYTYDTIQGIQVLVSPIGKLAGAIAAQPAYQYPGNQQQSGVIGVTATERVAGINTISYDEAKLRQTNGLLYLGYEPSAPRGPQLGLPMAMASDGATIISDVRMLKSIADGLQAALGAVVGKMMNPQAGPQFGQPAFGLALDAGETYLNNLLNGPPQQIAAYQFLLGSANTTTTVQQGFLIPNVLVTTFSAAQFILVPVQVGKTVQIAVTTP